MNELQRTICRNRRNYLLAQRDREMKASREWAERQPHLSPEDAAEAREILELIREAGR